MAVSSLKFQFSREKIMQKSLTIIVVILLVGGFLAFGRKNLQCSSNTSSQFARYSLERDAVSGDMIFLDTVEGFVWRLKSSDLLPESGQAYPQPPSSKWELIKNTPLDLSVAQANNNSPAVPK